MPCRATLRPRWRLQPELEELSKRRRITRLEDGRYQPVASNAALRHWPEQRVREAHRALADTLPPGTPVPESSPPWQLYDLAADPGETTDIAAARPELAKALEEIWRRDWQ